MKMRSWNKMAVAALAAFGLSAGMTNYTSQAEAPDANTASTEIIAPAPVNLPAVPAEVLRMYQAGMSDDVITSYIQQSANPYSLDASQIIYLHDLGVSSGVLNSLVNHGGTAANIPAPAANETPDMANANTPSPDTANASPQETPPVNGPAADFYQSLAPYGNWVYLPAYGWCWQPTVVVTSSTWLPYCNNGCWLWTTSGWYWNSYYSWGWAPFHYGRWCQHPHFGWLWCPDHTWGSAWVCWRGCPGFCGWAALPPGACFTAHGGWTFHGAAVGVNFGFGLGSSCFTFCDFNHFCNAHPFNNFQHGNNAVQFFHGSQVNNNITMDGHNNFINRGVDPSHIEAATHMQLQPVSVRELPNQPGHSGNFTMPDRLMRNGNSQTIYRPGQNISAIRNPMPLGQHVQMVNHWGANTATRGFTSPHQAGNAPQFQHGGQNGFRPSMPGVSWNRAYQNTSSRQWGGFGNPQMRNFSPTPNYQRYYADSQRYTAMARSAPVWHSTPGWNSAPAGRSMSSGGHGGGHGGGTFRGGSGSSYVGGFRR